jgi:hypothetical protein
MNLPTFIVIGAARSGTTSLYQYLKQHSQVYMSVRKETNFLAFAGESTEGRGLRYRRMVARAVGSLEAYGAQFAGRTHEIAIGEASPKYLFRYERSIENIKKYAPQAKLIAILRHPVERAYSHYLLTLGGGKEPLFDFAAAVEAEAQRAKEDWEDEVLYVARGFYYAQLRAYYDSFPAEQIRVYLHEDLTKDAAALMRDLYGFIGVDPSYPVDVSQQHNSARTAGIPSSPLWAFVQRRLPVLREFLRWRVPAVWFFFRNRVRKQAGRTPPLDPEVRARLVEVYREDVLKVQDLIGRDLSRWLR